ncbi:hypothetical protein PFHG_03424 [Plasmodium falciparum HB3]|uniref:Plasmodium RESA N-terminal domain-containing protein n=1 Tax=Plasmodium falciparum (isolate HB3) TaxID=137071 RepID=A0A0L7KFJ9_PLAFX|nr:hypothetical protein PFHG_03424 [Plasmodium falciparum HB3]
MMYKRKSSIFRFYSADKNKKGKFHFVPFKFLFLSLYMFGVYYVFLNTSLENSSIECFKIINIHERNLGEKEKNSNSSQRKKNLNHKKEDVNKTKHNTNEIIYNEEKLDENNFSVNNYVENEKTKIENSNSINNINYNDISKQLTRQELFDVLNSFNECPPKEDLRNIWNHPLGVAKEGFYDIQKDLKGSIQKYLDNDIYAGTDEDHSKIFLYDRIWNENISRFYKAIATEELEYNKNFFILINGKHTLDDILSFIYSFLEHIKILKSELHEKHQKELSQKISQISNKKK